MTYNQLITTIQSLLESNPIIQTAKNITPKEWLMDDDQPVYPICCYSLNSGTLNKGRQHIFSIQFFFLDKSGAENEFMTDVISDQLQISNDIVELIRGTKRDYTIDDSIQFTTVSDKYEDYLAGISFTTNITTQSDFDGCDVPTN
jgi:hypothetical protein